MSESDIKRVPRTLSDVQRANLAKGREALVARRAADKAARERGEVVPVRPRKKKVVPIESTSSTASTSSITKSGSEGIFEFIGKLNKMSEEQRASLYKLPFGF